VKVPGWANLMTLLSDTAYHSFIGEVALIEEVRFAPDSPLEQAGFEPLVPP
jgi:hypothetical protein